MLQKKPKGMAVGAVLGTLLGSLSAVLASDHKNYLSKGKEWVDKAKNIGETVLNEVQHFGEPRHNGATPAFVKGTLIGLILGAGTALLVTPKTGKQLRNNLSKRYQEIFDKTQDIINLLNENEYVEALTHPTVKKAKSRVKRAVAKVKRQARAKAHR